MKLQESASVGMDVCWGWRLVFRHEGKSRRLLAICHRRGEELGCPGYSSTDSRNHADIRTQRYHQCLINSEAAWNMSETRVPVGASSPAICQTHPEAAEGLGWS